MLDDLRARAGVTGDGRLLDLACGPDRVALALAPYFREVRAVDLEPEMIEVTHREVERCGLTNVHWTVGRAEEYEAPPGSLELITIGEAFHRLDQQLIARRALEWLAPGRCLATMGCTGLGGGTEPWQAIAADVTRKWLGRVAACAEAGSGSDRPRGAVHDQEVLRAAGFVDVQNHEFTQRHDWTVDSIVGHLYSRSATSRRVLGDSEDAFERDLRRRLLAHDAQGRYSAVLSCGYTLASRPSHSAGTGFA
jgi:SAM-dependent methyltransferase